MRKKVIFFLLIMTVVNTFGSIEANAGFPAPPGFLIPPGLPGSSVNVRIDGYVPAPPGVNVQIDSGRPYYVERERRIYIEREKPSKHNKKKHYKKHNKHDDDRDHGRNHGRDKHSKHDR